MKRILAAILGLSLFLGVAAVSSADMPAGVTSTAKTMKKMPKKSKPHKMHKMKTPVAAVTPAAAPATK